MPASDLNFTITFHGPVRVGRGRAAPGVDDTVDPDVIVPGSSLKGLMRAEAVVLLDGRDETLVEQVFGGRTQPSPWHWDDVRAEGPDDRVRTGARIRVDSAAGTTVDGGLFSAQYRWPRTARFAVRRFTALSERDRRRHELLLWASALSVHSIGADRNRGFGWVDLHRDDVPIDDDVLDAVATLAEVAP